MSEYQYYEFLALDRPLTEKQRAELRSISTRAEITATRFVNEYQWGDLKGDPLKMVERYFDAFLYLANWGTRRVMFRLPRGVLDAETAGQYCYTDTASLTETGSHLIVSYALSTSASPACWTGSTRRPCPADGRPDPSARADDNRRQRRSPRVKSAGTTLTAKGRAAAKGPDVVATGA
jgi:hypothetical protein